MRRGMQPRVSKEHDLQATGHQRWQRTRWEQSLEAERVRRERRSAVLKEMSLGVGTS